MMKTSRSAVLSLLLLLSVWATAANGAEIRWRSGATRTVAKTPAEIRDSLETLAARPQARHAVVQFDGPVGPAERTALEANGVTLLSYLGNHAFFAALAPERLNADAVAQVVPMIDAGAIERDWKLHRALSAGNPPDWSVVAAPEGAGEAGRFVAAYVLFHRDVALVPGGMQLVQQYGATIRSQLRSINGLVIELPEAAIAALADEDAVQWIEPPLPKMSGVNDSNRALIQAEIVQQEPPGGYGLDGTGVNVLLYDEATAYAAHPDFGGRLYARDGSGTSVHATHVAGTIGGDGTLSGGLYRGMAPGVTIQSYGFEQEGGLQPGFLYTDPGDMESDYDEAINIHGVVISNNSIGVNVANGGFACTWEGDYGVTSALIDAIVGGSLGGPFRVVWANGNERRSWYGGPGRCGAEYRTTPPPACAKNHITVGAVNSNDDSMTVFSSWGPADDGRLTTEIVAPGCENDGVCEGICEEEVCGSALPVCPENTVWSTYHPLTGYYSGACGTSMAAPTVTGACALLLEDYRDWYPGQPDPRNSTLKVLLAHNAVDLGNTGPDFKTGYGSVRIKDAIDFMRTGNFLEAEADQGGVYSIPLYVDPALAQGEDPPRPPLKITLAWDDFQATPNVLPALVNDLDLVVIDPSSQQHFPWTLDPANPGAPAKQTQMDHFNNLVQVYVDAPLSGYWLVEVRGFSVLEGPQPFSLAWSHELATDCLTSDPQQDCPGCGNGIKDGENCEPDCDGDGVPNSCVVCLEPDSDCDWNGIPDECEPVDCNENGTHDPCDIRDGPSDDCNLNLIPDECEIDESSGAPGGPFYCTGDCDPDCNDNGVPDLCDVFSIGDCDRNFIPDECQAPADCNENQVFDVCDILDQTSDDCNLNLLPDECEIDENSSAPGGPWYCTQNCDPDCNGNGIPDSCDLQEADCRADCNDNGILDVCDIAEGTSSDCTGNGFPDECERNCDGQGEVDSCEIANGAPDCNRNGMPDSCEWAAGDCDGDGELDECEILYLGSSDCNDNGIPDECEACWAEDCDNNLVPDCCDADINANGVADDCESQQPVVIHVDNTHPTCTDSGSGTQSRPFCNIQPAIDSLPPDAGHNGVVAVVVGDGTYTGTANRDIHFEERAVTLRSANGAANCVIDAQGQGRAFVIESDEGHAVRIEGLTIRNGYSSKGGGIYVDALFSAPALRPTIVGCVIESCTAYSYGGGVSGSGNVRPILRDCTIRGNSAKYGGGGVYIEGQGASLTLERCTVVGNWLSGGAGQMLGGGGILFQPSSYLPGGRLRLADCTISGNSAWSGRGAGVFCSAVWDMMVAQFIMVNCTVSENTGARDVGVAVEAWTATIANSTVVGNLGNVYAGTRTGGLYALAGRNTTVRNCVFWGNTAPQMATELFGNHVRDAVIVEHSDIEGGRDGARDDCGLYAWFIWGEGNIEADPMFVDPANGDYRLSPGSPCADAGANDAVPFGITTDADGNPRTWNDTVDMGASELVHFYVRSDATGAGDGSSWEDAYTQLQTGLESAAAIPAPGAEFWVAAGTYFPAPAQMDPLASFELGATERLYGGFCGNETARWQRDPASHVTTLSGSKWAFHVVKAIDTQSTAVLDGFTISGGLANDRNPHDRGAGLYIQRGGPAVRNCIFQNNEAKRGAAVYCDAGASAFKDSVFRQNISQGPGAAIYAHNPPTGTEGIALDTCSFEDNSANILLTASDKGGGGIYVADTGTEPVAMTNCRFERNSAKHGGGLYADQAALRMTRCRFLDNRVVPDGAEIFASGGGVWMKTAGQESDAQFINCLFGRNQAKVHGGGVYFETGGASERPKLTNCTFAENNADFLNDTAVPGEGGGLRVDDDVLTITNSVFWGNRDSGGENESAQIHFDEPSNPPTVSHTCIQGLSSGGAFEGNGNIDDDPLLRDPTSENDDGTDPENDFRLRDGSPCIDEGNNDVPDLPEVDLDDTARIFNGTVDMGAYEFECQMDDDCYDADICTHDQCEPTGICKDPPDPNAYGDVNHDDLVGVFDILCILAAIEHDFTNCTFESCDIEPCTRDCDDDGMFEDGNCKLNVFDVYAILYVLEGYIACCGGQALGGGMGGMSAGFSGAGTAELTLEVREVSAHGLVIYEVDVYASEFVDLRAYEVALDVNGAGGLEVQRVYIDTMRPEYVFAGLESYSGLDTPGGRIVTVSIDSGVASTGPVYLGTFVLRATEDAHGTFEVVPRAGDGTILLDSFGERVMIVNSPVATVSLP